MDKYPKKLREALEDCANLQHLVDLAWKHFRKKGLVRARSEETEDLHLHKTNERDRLILELFEKAGLDPKELIHWKRLVSIFAQTYLKSGAPKKRDAFFYFRLWEDAQDVSKPGADSAGTIAQALLRHRLHRHLYGDYTQESLRKEVGRAFNPAYNVLISNPSGFSELAIESLLNESTLEDRAITLAYLEEVREQIKNAFMKKLEKEHAGFKAPAR